MKIIKDLRELKRLSNKYDLKIDKTYKYILSDVSFSNERKLKKDGFNIMFFSGCFYPYLVKLETENENKKIRELKEKIKPIIDFLKVNINENDKQAIISLKDSIKYKDFKNFFPEITRNNLIKLFDYSQDNKKITYLVIKQLSEV